VANKRDVCNPADDDLTTGDCLHQVKRGHRISFLADRSTCVPKESRFKKDNLPNQVEWLVKSCAFSSKTHPILGFRDFRV
jgi:hypothetical protein